MSHFVFAPLLLASFECQIFLLGGRRAMFWSDMHVHLMRIDLSQYLSWGSGGKITLMKHRHNMPIFVNGEDTQDFSHNIGWLHLSESKTIDILYKNIQARIHFISTFIRKYFK
jgi:hypothetical protein